MSEYGFIIDSMKWSYSRLSSFHTCKFGWYTQYIECVKGEQNAMSQYGSLCHKILELYANGDLLAFRLTDYFTEHFNTDITYDFPKNKYVDIRESYFKKGVDFFDNIDLVLDDYEILGVEKEVHFTIDGKEFVGYIDLLLKDKITKEIIILDHKSADIKFKKDGTVSKTDIGKVEGFKHQLYLYSIAIKKEYGEFPKKLIWNLFKERRYLTIDFDEEEYNSSIEWAKETIKQINDEFIWEPNPDYFFCYNICNYRNCACQYKPKLYSAKKKKSE